MAGTSPITVTVEPNRTDRLVSEGKMVYADLAAKVAIAAAAAFGIGKVLATMTPVGRASFGAATFLGLTSLTECAGRVKAEARATANEAVVAKANGEKGEATRKAYHSMVAAEARDAGKGKKKSKASGEDNEV